MARHNYIGRLGEEVATRFFIRRGYKVIDRNYSRAWGEIDLIIREKSGVVHFVEVKTTSRVLVNSVDDWNPADLVHNSKLRRLKRIITTYMQENNVDDWVFDVIIVYLNQRKQEAKCNLISDIVL